jgi:hypothetical protein
MKEITPALTAAIPCVMRTAGMSSNLLKSLVNSRRFVPLLLTRGVTRRCRLSWLTTSALVYESKCGGMRVGCVVSANEYSCAHHVTWSPNKPWGFNSIFNLYYFLPIENQSHMVKITFRHEREKILNCLRKFFLAG